MWPFKKHTEQKGELIKLKIVGMHCASCALTIDDELEEIDGVYESRSSYANGEVSVRYEPTRVQLSQMHQAIEKLGYTVA